MTRSNSLQAVLAREAAAMPAVEQALPPPPTEPGSRAEQKHARFYRPSRDGRRFLGGHFEPDIVRQMKLLAVEADTTTQALLEEALDLLFVKKGKGRLIANRAGPMP